MAQQIDTAEFETRFGGLAANLERDELAALVLRLRPLEVNAGEVLITEGTPTGGLHLVWEGALDVAVGDANTHVGTVERGGYVGEVSLLDPGPASATVRSEQGATVLVLGPEELASFEEAHPRAGAALLHELARVLAQRVRLYIRQFPAAALDAPIVAGIGAAPAPGVDNLSGAPTRFAAGARLAQGGRRAAGAYLIRSGTVLRMTTADDGASGLLALPTGAIAGAEALLPAVLATDLVADGEVEAGLLSAAELARQAHADPLQFLAVQRAVAAELARELRALTVAHQRMAPSATPSATTDVAVIGGGMLGLAYAWFVKEAAPQTAVTVLERRSTPGYKIGESTLGTTTRAMQRMGLSFPVMRRLFGIKAGIRFWWTGPGDPRLHGHVDAGDVDETFQVERRVLETALMETARRRGIDVREGTKVQVPTAEVSRDGANLPCTDDGGVYDLRARLVCDASGPAAVLTRRFGLYRRAPERLGTFNTHSYYAYFTQKEDVAERFWDAPATRHICFEQGWCWFITVTSWEGTPQENLVAMIRFLLDHPEGRDESYPTRRDLEERFGCRSEPILSVGFTVREDLDTAGGLSLEGRFRHYLDRYPAVRGILDNYELMPAPYGKKPYSAFLNLVHDASAVTGDGWCAVGDAAGFTNPLFSPGLTFGTGAAYEAAQDTVRALASRDVSRASFRAYQHYAERMHPTLMAFNDMLYRSFRQQQTFERALAMFLFHSAGDVLQREVYSDTDPYVWDLLNPEFTRRVDEVRRVLRTAEQRGSDPEDTAREVRDITDPYIRSVLDRPEMREMDLRPALREFDASGERRPDRHPEPGPFTAVRCGDCRLFYDGVLERCCVCGADRAVGVPV